MSNQDKAQEIFDNNQINDEQFDDVKEYTVSLTLSVGANNETEAYEEFFRLIRDGNYTADSLDCELED